MQQQTECPITGVDVLREGDSQVVLLTLSKPPPSTFAQDSSKKSWIQVNGAQINGSGVPIPDDRTWWHATHMEYFGEIVRDSLRAGPQGNYKGVYAFTGWETCAAYGGQVVFAFRSHGMVAKLGANCNVPEHVPEGVIGYFDSAKKRQWVHHPRNLQETVFFYIDASRLAWPFPPPGCKPLSSCIVRRPTPPNMQVQVPFRLAVWYCQNDAGMMPK